MKQTISKQIADLIADAMERGLDQGQPVEYDVSMIAVPGQNGQPSPMVGLSFTIQSLALDTGHAAMFLMPPTIPSQDDMDGMVRKVVENLIQVRTDVATQQMAEGNGHRHIPEGVSKSGLILPGQG